MSSYDPKTKEAIRNTYITSCKTLAEVAKLFNVSNTTANAWKLEAQKGNDDWDTLRKEFFLVDTGMEDITRQMLAEYILQHKQVVEDLKLDTTIDIQAKVVLLAKLSQSLSKTINASRYILPKTNRLTIALDVIQKFIQFIQSGYPQHTSTFLEVLESFGKTLIKEYSQ